jgi:DNA-binding transcriptional ArsR family regulator
MDAFEAIADPVRRDILVLLSAAPLPAGDVARAFDHISRPAVSRHLRVLRETNLVVADLQGREWRYRVEPAGLAPLTSWLGEVRAAPWSSHLDALATEVHRTRRDRVRSARPASPDTKEHIA